MKKYAIVILAAGKSSRMKRPKQLLPFKEKTIIENIIYEAIESNCGDVFVVLGAYQKEISKIISDYPVEVLFNAKFEEGIGSTIAEGVRRIEKYDGVLILLADQVFTARKTISEIFDLYENSSSSIILSDYGNGNGPPVFFEKKYFNELKKLTTDEGAKKVIRQNNKEVVNYFFPKGAFDIDTPEDFEQLTGGF